MNNTIAADKVTRAKEIIDGLRLKNGMYFASPHMSYRYLWTRDNCYIALTYINDQSDIFERTMWSLLDYYLDYEWKIDIHNQVRPQHTYERIHIRFSEDLKEIPVEWNHKQNDCLGIFLYLVGEGTKKGKRILRNENDKRIVQKIVNHVEILKFYEDEEGGFWEELNEKRSSSIAAVTKGLMSVKDIVNVPECLIKKGMETLYELFPYETPTRKYDLAMLSQIYPYNREPLNNRRDNLRVSNKSTNAMNVGLRKSNSSGVTGVNFDNRVGRWRAYISYEGKRFELGHFKEFTDAVKTRLDAESKYHKEFASQRHLFEQYGVK